MEHSNNRPGMHSQGAGASPELSEAEAIDAQISALQAYFRRQPGMRCLLAVDPSQRDLIPEAGQGASLADLDRAFVDIDHDGFPDAHRPYVVELDLSDRQGIAGLTESVRLAFEDRRPESMVAGMGQRIGGWLATSASATDVAGHWSRHVLQYDEEGRACVLRFYDARALSLIWPMLRERQQQALMGPVNAWHALDAGAKPCTYTRTAGSQTALSLTPEQWQGVHRHGVINSALALHATNIGRQPGSVEVEVAEASAARAAGYGLLDAADQVAFIGHALTWHPQFDLHPKVLQILGARAPDDFYTAVIGELTADDIDEIRGGAWYDRLNISASR